MGKRRTGSVASSRRSQQRVAASEKVEPVPALPATAPREGSTRSKSKKSGGLLSCLPCFAPKDTHTGGEEESTENVKQVNTQKPVRATQATPSKHQEPNAAESSAADSKDPLDEKTGEIYGADRRDNEKPIHGDATMESGLSTETQPKIVTRSSSIKQSLDHSLPALPTQTDHLAAPQIAVQTPTPGTTPVESRPSHEQAQIIHDRTDEQEQLDTDIEAEGHVPVSTNDVHQEGEKQTEEAQSEGSHKIDLPPPPPLEQRQLETQKQLSDPTLAESNQKYLLGPIQPRFQGKKCLVLDLDETLVHSSFKVSPISILHIDFTNHHTDPPSSRLHHSCRN
jgi:RNA polymerase II subunit A small phosphatase-like protein